MSIINQINSICRYWIAIKYRYEKLKNKENKKKQKNVVIKIELIHIDTHDMETKINQIDKFLDKDYKVKIRPDYQEETLSNNS